MLSLRRATVDDLAVLFRIHDLAFTPIVQRDGAAPPGYGASEWHQQMLTQADYWAVCSMHVVIGGAVVLRPRFGHHHLERLFLHPQWQRQGLGGWLLQQVEQQYPATVSWSLQTSSLDRFTHGLYERHGYRHVGQTDPAEHVGGHPAFCLWWYEKGARTPA